MDGRAESTAALVAKVTSHWSCRPTARRGRPAVWWLLCWCSATLWRSPALSNSTWPATPPTRTWSSATARAACPLPGLSSFSPTPSARGCAPSWAARRAATSALTSRQPPGRPRRCACRRLTPWRCSGARASRSRSWVVPCSGRRLGAWGPPSCRGRCVRRGRGCCLDGGHAHLPRRGGQPPHKRHGTLGLPRHLCCGRPSIHLAAGYR